MAGTNVGFRLLANGDFVKVIDLADELAAQCKVVGLPDPEREVRLWPGRRFRGDLVWRHPYPRLLVEADGGGWVGGRHSRGPGIESDCEKVSLAAVMGYRVLRVTARQIKDGRALGWIIQILCPKTDS